MACIYLLNSRGGPQCWDFVITIYSYPLLVSNFLLLSTILFPVVSTKHLSPCRQGSKQWMQTNFKSYFLNMHPLRVSVSVSVSVSVWDENNVLPNAQFGFLPSFPRYLFTISILDSSWILAEPNPVFRLGKEEDRELIEDRRRTGLHSCPGLQKLSWIQKKQEIQNCIESRNIHLS